jgi:hypothetical protein
MKILFLTFFSGEKVKLSVKSEEVREILTAVATILS